MDLSTNYAGIEISSPIVIGASPLALDTSRITEFADHGAGAIVMPSIFEEQINDTRVQQSLPTSALPPEPAEDPVLAVGNDLDAYNGGTVGYLRYIEQAKAASAMPVIASIHCLSTGHWMTYANELASAGADAIELNLYHYEADPQLFAEDIEKELVDRVRRFCDVSPLPVSVKVLPQFTCLANVAFRIAGAGAKSVCLFGQSPTYDVQAQHHIGYRWRFSSRADLRVCLDGIHQVYGAAHNLTLAAGGGIEKPDDAITAIRLGASAVMLTSAIYRHGAPVIPTILKELSEMLVQRKLLSLQELIGSQAGGFSPDPEAARRQAFTSALAQSRNIHSDSQVD